MTSRFSTHYKWSVLIQVLERRNLWGYLPDNRSGSLGQVATTIQTVWPGDKITWGLRHILTAKSWTTWLQREEHRRAAPPRCLKSMIRSPQEADDPCHSPAKASEWQEINENECFGSTSTLDPAVPPLICYWSQIKNKKPQSQAIFYKKNLPAYTNYDIGFRRNVS